MVGRPAELMQNLPARFQFDLSSNPNKREDDAQAGGGTEE